MSNETDNTKWMVTFTYTVVVDAEDGDEAEDLAHAEFDKNLRYLSAGDFAMSDAEDVTTWWD